MKLSVVILNFNVRHFLEFCLRSVEAATRTIEAEIIVVDNNSSDDSCTMVKNLFPNVILIENEENTGFSRGNNIGVAKAKGDYLCILNPDTVVAEDTFITLLKFVNQTKNTGITGCRLIDGNGVYLPESKRNVPTPMVSIKKIFGFDKPYYAGHLEENEIGGVDVLVGAFMFIKTSIYRDMNGFDEDYFMYGEDIDFSYKVLKSGYQNQYIGDTTIIHFKGESTPKNIVYRKRFYEAMQIFYKKHFRRNFLYDILVVVGTKVMPLLERRKPINTSSNTKELVLDGNTMSYKEIISSFDKQSRNLKIRPKHTNFTISSNGAKSRGKVRNVKEF